MRRIASYTPLLLALSLNLLSSNADAQPANTGNAAAATTEPAQQYRALSAQTRDVAERYLQAYLSRDWPRLFPLMAEHIHFADPTAKMVFGDLSQQGKPALTKYFTEVYPYVETHAFKRERSTFAGQHAVFIGESDWSFSLPGQAPVRSKTPLVLTLTVENGLVTQHQELADFQSYLNGRQQVSPGSSKP
ncbi:nuclear transport factor 2 family protein [Paucibacter sp. AS339]|uniref:nuclear transport factor 2 family protein n=1 Tax=Paucibacter hankyongi TaxID=3133434 RepID=UPI0030AFD82C